MSTAPDGKTTTLGRRGDDYGSRDLARRHTSIVRPPPEDPAQHARDLESLERDGFVILEDLLDGDALAEIRAPIRGEVLEIHTRAGERVGPDGKPKAGVFKAENGLLEYTQHLMKGKTAVSSPVYVKREKPEEYLVCEVAMQYHDGYSESLLTFANNINNVDGGTHGQGFKVALTRALNGYAKRAGLMKEKDPTPTGEDLREGLIAIAPELERWSDFEAGGPTMTVTSASLHDRPYYTYDGWPDQSRRTLDDGREMEFRVRPGTYVLTIQTRVDAGVREENRAHTNHVIRVDAGETVAVDLRELVRGPR